MSAEPTGNRFAVVTPDDHSATLIIVTILSLIFSCLVFAVRVLLVKWKRHGYDDAILGLAHLVALGQWISILIALQSGLGKALPIITIQDQIAMAKAAFAGRILLMPILCFSKVSVLLVIRSLFIWETRRKLLFIDITILLVAIWGAVSVLILSVNCSPSYILGPENGQCPNHVARIRAVMISEIITEFAVFILSPFFLCTFGIALRTKLLVVLAFTSRLPLIAFSALYLLSQTTYLTTFSTGTAIVPTIIYQQVLLGYSLMSATIPCLKSFFDRFKTGGVSYTVNLNARRIITASESSYELWNVKKSKGEGKDRQDEFAEESGARRISASLSKSWKGSQDGAGVGMDSQTSIVPMVGAGISV